LSKKKPRCNYRNSDGATRDSSIGTSRGRGQQMPFQISPSLSNKLLLILQPVHLLAFASILRWAVAAGEGSSRLGALWGLPPFSLVDSLHANGGGLGS